MVLEPKYAYIFVSIVGIIWVYPILATFTTLLLSVWNNLPWIYVVVAVARKVNKLHPELRSICMVYINDTYNTIASSINDATIKPKGDVESKDMSLPPSLYNNVLNYTKGLLRRN